MGRFWERGQRYFTGDRVKHGATDNATRRIFYTHTSTWLQPWLWEVHFARFSASGCSCRPSGLQGPPWIKRSTWSIWSVQQGRTYGKWVVERLRQNVTGARERPDKMDDLRRPCPGGATGFTSAPRPLSAVPENMCFPAFWSHCQPIVHCT